MIRVMPIECDDFKLMPYTTNDDNYIIRLHDASGFYTYDDVDRPKDSLMHKQRIKFAIDINTVGWICWLKEPVLRIGMVYFSDIILGIGAMFHPVIDKDGYKLYIERNHHFGKESPMLIISRQAIKYVFNLLKLQRVSAGFFTFNLLAINLCKKLGFKEEGVIRCGSKVNGKPVDIKILGLLKEEVLW